jgi:hypothetical protein
LLAPWRRVTAGDIARDIEFTRLPPDNGIVTPIAAAGQVPNDQIAEEIGVVADRLAAWPPGQAPDLVARTRNLLMIAAVPDVIQDPTEPFLPVVVFDHLRTTIPHDELVQVLYWIAMHPDDDAPVTEDELRAVGVLNVGGDPRELRNRTAIYAVKLLGRLTGQL